MIACENGFDFMLFVKLRQAPFEITRAFLSLASAQGDDEWNGEEKGGQASGRPRGEEHCVVTCRSEWADPGSRTINVPSGNLQLWQIAGRILPGTFSTSPPISSCSVRPGQAGT